MLIWVKESESGKLQVESSLGNKFDYERFFELDANVIFRRSFLFLGIVLDILKKYPEGNNHDLTAKFCNNKSKIFFYKDKEIEFSILV